MPRKKTVTSDLADGAVAVTVSRSKATADSEQTARLSGDAGTPEVQPVATPTVNRTAKTIQPLRQPAEKPADTPPAEPDGTSAEPLEPGASSAPAKPQPEAGPAVSIASQTTTTEPSDTIQTATAEPDQPQLGEAVSEAALIAREEAVAKRQDELEALVASGKYFVPINAVRRKRSRLMVITVLTLLVVAALVAVGVLASKGRLTLPFVSHAYIPIKL